MTTYNKKIKLKVLESKNLPMMFWKDDESVYKIYLATLREMPIIFSTMLAKYKELYWQNTWAIMAAEAWKMFRESAKECRTSPFIFKLTSNDGLTDKWDTRSNSENWED